MSCILTLKAVEKIVYSPAFALRTSVQFRTWLFWNPNVFFFPTAYGHGVVDLISAFRYSKIDTPLKTWQKTMSDRNTYSTNSQGATQVQWYDNNINPRYLNSTLQFRKKGDARLQAPVFLASFPDLVVVDSITIHTINKDVYRGKLHVKIRGSGGVYSSIITAKHNNYNFYSNLYTYTTSKATNRKVAYYESYFTIPATLGAAYTWVLDVRAASSPTSRTVNASTITMEISTAGLARGRLCKEYLGLGLSDGAFAKLFAGVIARKRCIVADYLISNMRSLYNIPAFTNEIYTVSSDAAVDSFFSRVSKKPGVYDENCAAIGGESTNIELLVQMTNFLNLNDTTLSLLSALQGDIFSSNALQIDGEVQDVAVNGLGFSFLYPVNVKAVHFVWASDNPPSQPVLRVLWKCDEQVVCDTKEVIAHKCRKVFSPAVYVTTFPVVAKYPFECRKWSVWLGGKFSENKIYLKKVIIELHKGKRKQWKSV